jgi:hypothetical protein
MVESSAYSVATRRYGTKNLIRREVERSAFYVVSNRIVIQTFIAIFEVAGIEGF